MISDKIKTELELYTGKKGKLRYYVIWIVPFFFIITSLCYLYSASLFGKAVGKDLFYLIELSIKGIDINTSYSGICIKGISCIHNSFMNLGFSLLMFLFAHTIVKKRKVFNNELISYLKDIGVWSD
ncbi:hypothetical protein JCM14469_43730 [Desulfatiferula olefinivorans]